MRSANAIPRVLLALERIERSRGEDDPGITGIAFDTEGRLEHLEHEALGTVPWPLGNSATVVELARVLGIEAVTPVVLNIPLAPTLRESWSLFLYDLGAMHGELALCRGEARLASVARAGHVATAALVGEGRRLELSFDLRGRTIGGAPVDLMMAWNEAATA